MLVDKFVQYLRWENKNLDGNEKPLLSSSDAQLATQCHSSPPNDESKWEYAERSRNSFMKWWFEVRGAVSVFLSLGSGFGGIWPTKIISSI